MPQVQGLLPCESTQTIDFRLPCEWCARTSEQEYIWFPFMPNQHIAIVT